MKTEISALDLVSWCILVTLTGAIWKWWDKEHLEWILENDRKMEYYSAINRNEVLIHATVYEFNLCQMSRIGKCVETKH